MEAPITEEELNAKRKAIVLKGLPLLALSFQTLGVFPIVLTPTTPCLTHLQVLFTPILALLAL